MQTERQGSFGDTFPPEKRGRGGDSWMSPHSRILVPFSGDPHEKIAREWMDGRKKRQDKARPFTTRRWRYRARDRAATDRLPRPPDLDDRPPASTARSRRPPDLDPALASRRVEWTTGSIEGAQCATDERTDGRTDGRNGTDRPNEPTERTERSLARVRSRVSSTAARARERERFEIRAAVIRAFIHSFIHSFVER